MIEPANVKKATKELEEENIRFRQFLREHAGPRELDQHFLALHQEIFAEYDCCKCTNCCRSYDIPVGYDDAKRIAAYLGMTTEAFIEKHLVWSETGFEFKPPCSFLNEDGKCRIQECKPAECKGFPYTDRPGKLVNLLTVFSFVEECPVLFEAIERLKEIYRFPVNRE